jgi:hypothetical protein
MIAFTAIYGDYDSLKPHPDHPLVDEWICYTDNPDLNGDGWDVRCEPLPYQHPRVAAKWWKTHPPQADVSVWLDGSVALADGSDYFDVLYDCLATSDLAMFEHPDRTCIYEEAAVSRTMQKYVGQPLEEQVALYRSRGWPQNGGLYASTTFARRHTPTVLQFGAAWFAHNHLMTYQDQLSLPVILDQYGLKPTPIPGNLWRNRWFGIAGHASDR